MPLFTMGTSAEKIFLGNMCINVHVQCMSKVLRVKLHMVLLSYKFNTVTNELKLKQLCM